jgi:hypothetical protein
LKEQAFQADTGELEREDWVVRKEQGVQKVKGSVDRHSGLPGGSYLIIII